MDKMEITRSQQKTLDQLETIRIKPHNQDQMEIKIVQWHKLLIQML